VTACPTLYRLEQYERMADHPNSATIKAYCRGSVPDESVSWIEEHIRDCAECALLIATTVRSLIAERGEIIDGDSLSREAETSDRGSRAPD
jgi:hypothetical protein